MHSLLNSFLDTLHYLQSKAFSEFENPHRYCIFDSWTFITHGLRLQQLIFLSAISKFLNHFCNFVDFVELENELDLVHVNVKQELRIRDMNLFRMSLTNEIPRDNFIY